MTEHAGNVTTRGDGWSRDPIRRQTGGGNGKAAVRSEGHVELLFRHRAATSRASRSARDFTSDCCRSSTQCLSSAMTSTRTPAPHTSYGMDLCPRFHIIYRHSVTPLSGQPKLRTVLFESIGQDEDFVAEIVDDDAGLLEYPGSPCRDKPSNNIELVLETS